MKTIKGIFALLAFAYFVIGAVSCAPATIERSVKAKQYTFAKQCKKGTCAAYGTGKRGTHKNYGM
jgi:hypothetical protein